MKAFLSEFKEFINRGNVMDLAVAVVIGAAFTAIVNSVVSDIIMPLVSAVTGGTNFEDMKLTLPIGAGESTINYGNLLNAIIQFLIIAFVVFLIVKALNKMKSLARKSVAEPVESATCVFCKEPVTEGATRCPHCTAVLPEPAKATSTAS